MKQTAVEWYSQQLSKIGITEELIGHLTKEAKTMERKQIIEARQDGLDNGFVNGSWDSSLYYDETYENNTRCKNRRTNQ